MSRPPGYDMRHPGQPVIPLLIIDALGNRTLRCLNCQRTVRSSEGNAVRNDPKRGWQHYRRRRWHPRREA